MPRKTKKINRRGNLEGSIFQGADGRWRGQVQLGYDAQGKPIRKSFSGATRPEVAKKVAEATSKAFNGQVSASEQVLLSTLISNYLWTFKRAAVSDVTFDWYLAIANQHLVPTLGNAFVREITATQVQTLLNKLRDEKGLAERTIRGVRQLLSQTYKHGIGMNAADVNPVSGTTVPKRSRVKLETEDDTIKAIPAAERAAILKATEGDQKMKTALTVLMFTGMRIGEFLALPWRNVDFENRIITIDRAITHTCVYNEDGSLRSRKTAVGDTKTACSTRKIQVSSIVFDVLREWRDALPDHLRRGVNKDVLAGNAVVFPNDLGNMRTYDGFRTTYRRFMSAHGLGDYTIHSYRHTFATMLLEQGVNPRVVQKLLGHRDIETTLGIYSHVLPEVFGGVADIMTTLHCDMVGDKI